jgi:choline-sulfatase
MLYDHVILISLDTLRSDLLASTPKKLWPQQHPSCRGPVLGELDGLVKQGAFFWNCITAAPYTSASHATYLTGKWPVKHGVFEVFNRRLSGRTIFSVARDLDYKTILKVDFPLVLGPFLGFDRDIDEFHVEDDDAAIRSICTSSRTFSLIHFAGLHTPYGFHNSRFAGSDFRKKVEELESEITYPLQTPADQLVATYLTEEDMKLLFRYNQVIEHHYIHECYDKLFQLYLDGASYFFRKRFTPFLDRLLSAVHGRKFLIAIFGDHGEEYDATSIGHFNSVAEGVLRVPLLFYGPEVPPGLYDKRVRTIDFAPTLLDLIGAPQRGRPKFDGKSLANTVRDHVAYPLRPAFAQAYVSDVTKYVAFQKRLLKHGKKIGSLQHFCYREAVYDDIFRLTRQNYQFRSHCTQPEPCAPKVGMYRFTNNRDWVSFQNADVRNELLSLLNAYNSLLMGRHNSRALPGDIRQQLILMGYRV